MIERVVALDLLLPLRAARAALQVVRPGGFVLNVSGVVAEIPTAGLVAYSAAKAGAAAGFRALAREVSGDGIDVIDVRPPYLESELAVRALHGVPPVAAARPRHGCGSRPHRARDRGARGRRARRRVRRRRDGPSGPATAAAR